MKRVARLATVTIVLGAVATGVGYFGMRVGRAFERNRICCVMTRGHDFAISVREAAGLLRFPSQVGQDRWVTEGVFPGMRNGFFLDVGSADGVSDSNTWALEQRGWTGICVDPFPTNMEGRTCQMFKEAVDGTGGQHLTFTVAGKNSGISDLLGAWKDHVASRPTVEVTTTTLGDILARAHAPHTIQFMSLDIEGAELEALKGLPFDTYAFGAMAIEHNYEEPKRSDIQRLLASHGYRRVLTLQQDDLYLANALADAAVKTR